MSCLLLLIFHIFCSRIYWCSAFNGGHRIEEARLDGKHRRTLLGNLGAVTSLTLDYENKWIYFADKLVHTIERVDFGGKNRKMLLSDVAYPQALTLYSNSIYFGDWKTRSVGRADKNTGQNRTRIMDNLEYVMDLLTYHKSRQTGMFYNSFLKTSFLSSLFRYYHASQTKQSMFERALFTRYQVRDICRSYHPVAYIFKSTLKDKSGLDKIIVQSNLTNCQTPIMSSFKVVKSPTVNNLQKKFSFYLCSDKEASSVSGISTQLAASLRCQCLSKIALILMQLKYFVPHFFRQYP